MRCLKLLSTWFPALLTWKARKRSPKPLLPPNTMVGPVDWSNGPVKNVSKTPLVSGQWQKEGDKFDLKIVANSAAPNIPLTGDLKLL